MTPPTTESGLTSGEWDALITYFRRHRDMYEGKPLAYITTSLAMDRVSRGDRAAVVRVPKTALDPQYVREALKIARISFVQESAR